MNDPWHRLAEAYLGGLVAVGDRVLVGTEAYHVTRAGWGSEGPVLGLLKASVPTVIMVTTVVGGPT